MLAFHTQGLGFRYQDRFGFCFARSGDLTACPGKVLTVEQQLLIPGPGVIKDGDAVRTDHGEFLLFKRVKPAHVDMSTGSSSKAQESNGGIRNSMVQVIAPHATD